MIIHATGRVQLSQEESKDFFNWGRKCHLGHKVSTLATFLQKKEARKVREVLNAFTTDRLGGYDPLWREDWPRYEAQLTRFIAGDWDAGVDFTRFVMGYHDVRVNVCACEEGRCPS